ncbi:MAG: 2,3-diphosphoglycerate-dependent phosphoglycerate mutase [Cytophagales bacterium]|nr:2,3-diphosphoglycerate-dependent phosphoglycerate mutase [Cytophaga sp.]
MAILVIVRHGQSEWNLENLFTGWSDIDLSKLGEQEAEHAGLVLRSYHFDCAYTSVLKRAIHTLDIIIHHMDATMPVYKSAALNERNYGDLQGLNKGEVGTKYGVEQLMLWRRSYTEVPPNGESLENTYHRVIPYYKKEIVPKLKEGKNILIVAHGNSLRALMMYLEKITPEDIAHTDLATGAPRLYEFTDTLSVLKAEYVKLPESPTHFATLL